MEILLLTACFRHYHPTPEWSSFKNVKLFSFQHTEEMIDGKVMWQVQAVTFCDNRSYV